MFHSTQNYCQKIETTLVNFKHFIAFSSFIVNKLFNSMSEADTITHKFRKAQNL